MSYCHKTIGQVSLRINRKSPVPIHVQLKAQLAQLIQAGEWTRGYRLPTVRQLAGRLGINRNTASRVFAELWREGFLSSERGRGTFVAPRHSVTEGARTRELWLVLDEALGRARRLGFSPAAVAAGLFVRAQASAGGAWARRAPVLVMECSRSRLRRISGELVHALPLRVKPLLIRDLRARVRRHWDSPGKYRLLVTTSIHVREIRRLVGKAGPEVVALPADLLHLPSERRPVARRLRRLLEHAPVVDRAGVDRLRRRLAVVGLSRWRS